MNTTTNTVITKKDNSGWKWFIGIMLVLIFFGLIFVAGSFLIFSKAVTEIDTDDYYVERSGGSGGKIAVVDLDYTILSSGDIVRQFKKFGKDESIKAIVLRVNTPGGGVAASQEMYEIVKRTRDAGKPVIVSMGSIAASGGYYVSCGSSYIVSNPGTLTGSIGVIISLMNFRNLAEKIGIEDNTIKSGDLKDAGNPLRKMNTKDSLYFQEIIDNSFQQFFEVVATERKIDREKLKEIATGRVFTGLQAKGLGLVDELGTFEDAIRIAAERVGIEGEPTIVREKRRKGFFTILLEGLTRSQFDDIKQEIKEEYIDAPLVQYKFVK